MRRFKFIEWIFGYKYIANHKSKEIHKIENLKKNCQIEAIENGSYCSEKKADRLIQEKGYDGCGLCNRKKHKR